MTRTFSFALAGLNGSCSELELRSIRNRGVLNVNAERNAYCSSGLKFARRLNDPALEALLCLDPGWCRRKNCVFPFNSAASDGNNLGLMLRAQAPFQLSAALGFVLLLGVARGMAGEPIIVGKETSKTDAIKESKFGKELSRPWEKIAPDSHLDDLPFLNLPRVDSVDPKSDRRRKLQERERKNWMSVLPGELQAEEEKKTFLNVREYDLEKESDSDNLMFREMRGDRSKNQSRTSNQKENQNTPPQRTDAEALERELAGYRAARQDTARTESKYGSHTASELTFKGIFGPAPSEAGQEMSLRDLLGTGQQVDKKQQALRDEFKAFLSGNSGSPTTPIGGLSDPINSWRRDMVRQPLNTPMSKPAEEPARTDGFAQSTLNASRQANAFAPVGGFGNTYQPATPAFPPPINSRPSASAWAPSPLPINRGMNSLGGH